MPLPEFQPKRFLLPDALRGFAVLLMIIFHCFYDLAFFKFLTIDFTGDPFWYWFPRLIVFLFLICVGIGLSLTHKKGINWKKLKKRLLVVGGFALIITVATFFIFPKNWVYFGTLHCIAVCSFLGVFLVGKPRLSLVLAIIILGVNIFLRILWGSYTLVPIGKWLGGIVAVDYIPLYPWFGVVCLGIYLEHIKFHEFPIPNNRPMRPLFFMGKHALVIYLLHQPLLFGMSFILRKLIPF